MLRRSGLGVGEIAAKLGVGRNTASIWCRPFPLTEKQVVLLKKRSRQRGLEHHRLAMLERVESNAKKLKEIETGAAREGGILSDRELFLTGIMLYWAEGFKHKRECALGFSNTDPRLVRFYLHWLTTSLGAKKIDLSLRVTANISLKNSAGKFEEFWSRFLGVPCTQFVKPFFQNTKQKKTYSANREYHGVLRVYVKKSSPLFKKMRGWITGLSECGNVRG